MKAALIGKYVDFVFFMGSTDTYPPWFTTEIERDIYTDEYKYTEYVPVEERKADYYHKTLLADYTVFIRKRNGAIFVTDYDVFSEMYEMFRYDAFTNSGLAAFKEDCIEYVECQAGKVTADYPDWFYEHFTESINFTPEGETVLFSDDDEVSVVTHSAFLRNRFGEIRGMEFDAFLRYYDPLPVGGVGD